MSQILSKASLRVYDETINQEIEGDETDFAQFFNNGTEPPKILLTTNVNAKKKASLRVRKCTDRNFAQRNVREKEIWL